MNCKNVLEFHQKYAFTYFITISTNYKYYSTLPIMRKFRNYIYNHDKNAHIISVKGLTKKLNGLHFHILVFTNIQLNYAKVHKHLPEHSDVRIELVQKRKIDIERVINYMLNQ